MTYLQQYCPDLDETSKFISNMDGNDFENSLSYQTLMNAGGARVQQLEHQHAGFNPAETNAIVRAVLNQRPLDVREVLEMEGGGPVAPEHMRVLNRRLDVQEVLDAVFNPADINVRALGGGRGHEAIERADMNARVDDGRGNQGLDLPGRNDTAMEAVIRELRYLFRRLWNGDGT